jgi:integrase
VPDSGPEVFYCPEGWADRCVRTEHLAGRVYLGRDPQTGTRKYHNQTLHGSFREAQRFLNLKLQQRDNGRVSRIAVLSLNQLLDQWLSTVVKARVRTRTFKDYEALLKLYIRPALGSRLIGTINQVEIQSPSPDR